MSANRDLENALIERLSADLERQGFKFVKAHRSWRRKTPQTTLAFHLAIIHHPADFDVVADLAVRLDALASLLAELLGGADAAAAIVGKFTVGVEVGNLTIGQQRRWTVATAEDVGPVACSLMEAFESVALPYYREFSNPEQLLAVLSGDSRECWIHAPFDHIRAIRAVALAFLLGRREQFEELAGRKRALLAMSKDRNAQRNLPAFDGVVEQLRRRWATQQPVSHTG